ncbi:MAG: 2-oxo acid dehydrogenase subunit E2 [Candidatus Eremiobacteraeota bacterium]|nr:2-oxo acid dehydrogenase subunit E2 [Candidatus Eremiobacteraeota bacterium]
MPQVVMPQLGETVTEGTVGRWLKKVGEPVAKYEPLLEVETDKVASEIPSPFAGTLSAIMAEEGSTVPVGSPVCEIAAAGEAPRPSGEAPSPSSEAPRATAPAELSAAPEPSPAAPAENVPAQSGAAIAPEPPPSAAAAQPFDQSGGNGARHSPAVRRLARMHHIDLSGVTGSGRGGRLTARDVIAHVESGSPRPAAPPAPAARPAAPPTPAATPVAASTAPAPPAAPSVPAAPTVPKPMTVAPVPVAPPGSEDTVIRLSQMRKTIAERMVLSKTTIPHAWSMVEADVTNVVRWRAREKDAFKAREGVNLTYLPIVIQAVCAAIREYPMVNATWAGDSIIQRKHINVGVAVDIEEGLIVPVIKDADRYSLAGLATTINELAARARSRKLTMDDLTDGTITVDNTGSLGSIASVPIINPPQAAIVTTEAIVRRPWVVDDAIAIRDIMNLCLSLDHRVLDGAVASHFLQAVKKRLESFSG